MLTELHHRDRNGEGRRIRAFDLVHVTHPLWLTELCPRNGGSEACCPLYLSHVKLALCC